MEYLLAFDHPIGRFKAAFFLTLGHERKSWKRLEADLLSCARVGEAEVAEATPYGQKYRVRAILKGPSGATAEIVSVWIVLHGEGFPRFITAFPGGAR